MARISATEAANRISQYLKDKTGKNRKIPPINNSIQEIMRENTVHVFNVGPWGYRENMGSFGYYFIPACEVGAPMEWERLKLPATAPGIYVPDHWEEGERRVTDPKIEYAAMKPLPGLMAEPLPKEVDECVWNLQDEGRYFANELLGVGIGHSQQNSYVRRGCFVAAKKEPSDKELIAARAELAKYMADLILEADRAWAQGPQKAEQVIRPEIHHVCAHWMNLTDRDWLRGTKPQGRVKCEMCGLLVDEGIATCQNGHIVDAEAYKRAIAQQEAIKKSMAVV
jgi:hypothetical protein